MIIDNNKKTEAINKSLGEFLIKLERRKQMIATSKAWRLKGIKIF